jgi:RimJ/RimL family protein N-acetyltransferase
MSARLAYGPDGAPSPDLDERLHAHLVAYLGGWSPEGGGGMQVVGWPGRLEPGWDGSRALAVVVRSAVGTVLSVAPDAVAAATRLSDRLESDSFPADLAVAVGAPGRFSPWLVLRWSTTPAAIPPLGSWIDADHPSLPEWLHAFPGRVLAAFDDDGRYLAGVGLKPHSRWGQELAVGTDEAARGRGLGRRVVAEAARAVLADGAVPLYVHHPDNVASAHVADAAGFPDLGWRMLVVFGG